LNEGFATYAEWLWSEEDGRETAGEQFDSWYRTFPARDPFWDLRIGNPGPERLFDFAVYIRGAMTLHRLRLRVGDEDFFAILQEWADRFAGGNVTTPQFVRLAEETSGKELTPLFQRWLFTRGKPAVAGATRESATHGTRGEADARVWLRMRLRR
jgi:aminopeptidase N